MQVLQEVNGDINAAIEFLIAESADQAGTQTDAGNRESMLPMRFSVCFAELEHTTKSG